jgi:hypothetical protein
MAKSSQSLRARVTTATGRRRKKPANPVQRAFDDVKQLVSGTGDRLFSRSGKRATTKQTSPKKAAASRKRAGQQRQAAAKRGAVSRIQERRATAKQGGRTRAKSR